MKCPYADCRKDYNDVSWKRVQDSWISPSDWKGSFDERLSKERIYLISRRCQFCERLFHDVYVGHENFDEFFHEQESTLELLVSYPLCKTKFESKNVPQKVLTAFNEAERCRSIGSHKV
jgi:hypothetical protein